MTSIQLDLFEETTPQTVLEQELRELKASQDHLRRSFFARQTEMSSLIVSLTRDVEALKEEVKEIKK